MINKKIHSVLSFLLAAVMLICCSACSGDSRRANREPAANSEKPVVSGESENKSSSSKGDSSKTNSSNKESSKDKTTSSKDNGKTEEEDIYKTFHRYEKWYSASADSHSAKCADCGKVETIKHIWNDGTVSAKPTKSKSGTLKFTCQICGKTKTEKVTYTALYGDGYSSGRKTAEKYSAASSKNFKLFDGVYSDNDYCALYGECKEGLTVMAQTADGCYATASEKGTFAMRVKSKSDDSEFLFSFWYNGKQIGKPFVESVRILVSDYDMDSDGWKPMIGYDNMGYFEKILDYAINKNQMSASEMSACTEKYSRRVKEVKNLGKGCEIICVLAPSALTIYPENIPSEFKKKNTTSYYDQVAKSLKNAGVTVLDLRATFKKHKNDKLPIYNKYDTHWTDYGAYLAYVELYKHISKKYPAAAPRKFSDFNWKQGYYKLSDIPKYFGIDDAPGYVDEYTVRRDMTSKAPSVIKNINRFKIANSVAYDSYSDEVKEERIYKTGNSKLPNVSINRNSYGAQIQDIIAERSNVTVINPMWVCGFNTNQYKENEINYVIYVLSEWEFEKITKS